MPYIPLILLLINSLCHTLNGMELDVPTNPIVRYELSVIQQQINLKNKQQAQKSLSQFQIRELRFKELLEQEQTEPDPSRWHEISELLNYVGGYVSLPNELYDALCAATSSVVNEEEKTVFEPEISYTDWLNLIKPSVKKQHSHDVEPSNTQKNTQTIPTTKKKKMKKKKKKKKKQMQQPTPQEDKQAQVSTMQRSPDLLFWDAIKERSAQQALAVLQNNKGKIRFHDLNDLTKPNALQAAIGLHSLALVEELLAQHANPNQPTVFLDRTTNEPLLSCPLIAAVTTGQVEVASALLAAGASANLPVISNNAQECKHPICIAAFVQNPTYTAENRARMIALLLRYNSTILCDKLQVLFRHPTQNWVMDLKNEKTCNRLPEFMACTKSLGVGGENILTLNADPQKFEDSPIQTVVREIIGDKASESIDDTLAYIMQQQEINKIKDFLTEHREQLNLNKKSTFYKDLTPLFFCIKHNLLEILQLIVASIDVNEAIHIPPRQLIVKRIGANGAVHIFPKENNSVVCLTPLCYALFLGRTEAALLLILNGANTDVKTANSEGVLLSPLDFVVDQAQQGNPYYVPGRASDLIRLLVLRNATEFAGPVTIRSPDTKEVESIDLKNMVDQKRIQELIAQDQIKTIICGHSSITLVKNPQGAHNVPLTGKEMQELHNQYLKALDNNDRPALCALLDNNQKCLSVHAFPKRIAATSPSPLEFALLKRSADVCLELIERGANPHGKYLFTLNDNVNFSISYAGLAVNGGMVSVVKALIAKGADVRESFNWENNKSPQTMLSLLTSELGTNIPGGQKARNELICILLLAGAKAPEKKVMLVDKDNKRKWLVDLDSNVVKEALPFILNECTETIKCTPTTIELRVLAHAIDKILASINQNGTDLEKKLWTALHNDDKSTLPKILADVSDVTVLTKVDSEQGYSMLHYCVLKNNPDMCTLLLEKGANPNAITCVATEEETNECVKLSATPLTFAIINGFKEIAQLMLDYNADPNLLLVHETDSEEEYPLDCAVQCAVNPPGDVTTRTYKELIALLLLNGATDYHGSIIAENITTNTKKVLDLHNNNDLNCIQKAIMQTDLEDIIICDDKTLTIRIN